MKCGWILQQIQQCQKYSTNNRKMRAGRWLTIRTVYNVVLHQNIFLKICEGIFLKRRTLNIQLYNITDLLCYFSCRRIITTHCPVPQEPSLAPGERQHLHGDRLSDSSSSSSRKRQSFLYHGSLQQQRRYGAVDLQGTHE